MKTIAWALVAGFAFSVSGAVWTNGNWSVAANWKEGVVPEAGAAVTISPAVSGQTLTVDVDSVSVGGLTFSGNPFTLVGGAIAVAGNLTVDVVVTCDCDLSFTGNRKLNFNKNCTFNGSVTGSGSLTVGGSNNSSSSARASSIVFNGPVTAGAAIPFNGSGWYGPYNVYFYGKVTASSIGQTVYQTTAGWLYAQENDIGTVYEQNSRVSIYPMSANALTDRTVINMPNTSYGTNPQLNLRNFSQTIDRITTGGVKRSLSGQSASDMTYSLRSYGSEASDAKPTTLTLNATENNQNHVRVYDKITLVYNPEGDFTQTFATNFAHTTSGDIIVSNGTFRVGGTSTFANVKRIVIADGATFDLATEAANALAGVTNIVLGADSRFAIAASAETPFAASAVALELAADSAFELPEGANYLFKSIKVGESYLDGGNYTGGGEVPFAGPGVVTVPDVERESVEATWIGGGEDENVAVAGNWQGAAVPPLKEGSLIAFFAAGGVLAEVSDALDFKGLRFGGEPAEFTLAANSPGATLTLRQGGIEVDASRKAALALPLMVKSDQKWTIGAASGLEFKDPVAMKSAYAVEVSGSGATSGSGAAEQLTSALKLEAENGFLGDMNISGTLVNVFSSTNAFGPASDVPVTLNNSMLRLNGGTVERPVALLGQNNKYGWFHVQAGTNVFTKLLSQDDVYWRPRLSQGSVLVTEGGVSAHCDVLSYGGGEWIIRNKPFVLRNVDSTVSALQLTGNETVRFETGGNVVKRLKLEGGCKVHCGVDNPFSGSTWLFMSNRQAVLDLHGHEVSFSRVDSFSGGTVTSENSGVLKFTAQELTTTNRAVRFTGAAGIEMCGTGAIVITNAMESAGSVSVTKGRLEFAGDGSWANSTDVNVGGTGRLVLAKRKTFSRQAELTLADGGVVEIPAGVVVNVKTLRIGGKTFAAGTFGGAESSAENKAYAANFAGAGMVQVGNGFTMILR